MSARVHATAQAGWSGQGADDYERGRPGRDWRRELDATGRFEEFAERSVANEQRGDLESLRHRVASMSFIAAMPDAERAPLLDEAERLLLAHGIEPGVEVSIPARTVVRWARRRGPR